MRELKVTQQSPRSQIVIQCHTCHSAWYIEPDAQLTPTASVAQIIAAVEHDCQEKK